ncbi:molybdate ABC transporter substrate-binding protein [Thalassovita taeanensis]|uniref:Molybdate transport system substrate-binding protein n=1 Tax=Thalassovita taeanensis TaxID=657014 RepID=A0A1H9A6R6_9RHOB|nr:molybdate ABC transporter substrate-binding protein [Thalassovita taeanensis]SEP72436.1 molybdate transport system substrate-binding protein [Thalassovita taeanensis]
MRLPRLLSLILSTALIAGPLSTGAATAGQVTVFAAASLKTALDEVTALWAQDTGNTATLSFVGSSALARQIEAGAPADLFISANTDWMDRLESAGLLQPGSRADLLGNALVLIGHGADHAPVTLTSQLDLPSLLGPGKLAMALIDAVPAGIYGKAALTHLGLWNSIAPQVAQTDNVRAALALVARGEAPMGIVYATDAAADPSVTVLAEFPADSHPPITYPAAVLADSTAPEAPALLTFLQSPTAMAIFLRHGFTKPQAAE